MLARYKAADQAVQNFLLDRGRQAANLSNEIKAAKANKAVETLSAIQNKDPKVALQNLTTDIVAQRSLNPFYQLTKGGREAAEALGGRVTVGDAASIRDNLGDVASARARVLDPAANLLGYLGGRKKDSDFEKAHWNSNEAIRRQVARAGVAGVAGGSALTAAGSGLIDLMAYIQSSNEQIAERADKLV